MSYIVKIGREALAAMLMNGLETFLLPMQNAAEKPDPKKAKVPTRKKSEPEKLEGHEIFGYIFGTMEAQNNKYIYSVDLINFDITALSTQDSVRTNDYSLEIKGAISDLLLPKTTLLGSFHTHPYILEDGETLTDKFGSYMWMPSPHDEADESASDLQLELILAVVNARKKLTKGTIKAWENCLQFDVENIRFCLAAYIRRSDKNFDYPPYVPYNEVKLQVKNLFKKAKELNIDEDIKAELFKK